MLKYGRVMICIGVAAMLTVTAPAALAKYEEENHDHGEVLFDTTTGRVIMPSAGDFVDGAGDDDTGEGGDKAAGGVGVNGYVDVNEDMKAGVLTPFYRFSRAFAVKAHVPLIWDRTLRYFGDTTASTSGLGDVIVDADYTRHLSTPGTFLRFTGSVKLATGDEEKTVDDSDGFERNVPLGTGTTDYIVKGQYVKSTPDHGLIFGALYRKNSPYETSQDNGANVITTKSTTGNQVAAVAFGRKRASEKFWVHMGVSVVKLGKGKVEVSNSDGSAGSESDLEHGGTLIDIFPGVSYALGPLSPYLGVRIPLGTSFDDEFRFDERNTSIIFQFSYSPDSLAR